MIPLADMHCHLLAGLDDGRRAVVGGVEVARIVGVGRGGRVGEIAERNVRDDLALAGQEERADHARDRERYLAAFLCHELAFLSILASREISDLGPMEGMLRQATYIALAVSIAHASCADET